MKASDPGCPPLVPPGRALQLLLWGHSLGKPSSALGSCVHPRASGGLAHVRLRSICPLQAGAFAFQSLPVLGGAQLSILLHSEAFLLRGSSLVCHHAVPRFPSLRAGRKTKPSSRGGAARPEGLSPSVLTPSRDETHHNPGWSLRSSHCRVTAR